MSQGYQAEFWFAQKTGVCEHCKERTGLRWSATGSVAEDANPGMWLCEPCDLDHQEYWEEMWAEYWSQMM